jgi:hypothetical protein
MEVLQGLDSTDGVVYPAFREAICLSLDRYYDIVEFLLQIRQ